ncbi:hypothetical protein TPHA_0B03460 [Tetrapisispora phaffii CBS 4417]|uniref:Uncharacterized protein n=1 Tax=Tetrapisispora phaffii (strain ATCC 24235 / CBS 4417 / NBRC 1672 / NRRL Y-8282 / UCD 70-5) TaxID=1071381 RepID=G8BPT5_TETPH|nr:hypothetical protein TPHA_0B03460 [Tetrapisispora phaffii CBS 4417]CCE62016.1 hypothetical protein TPHA_0B03460 [Tetrapisispora phaffii CBS 4417]
MSFLSKLSALKKKTENGTVDRKSITPTELPPSEVSLLPVKYSRSEDPAVKRLKELRRKENLKNNITKNKAASRSATLTRQRSSTTSKIDNSTETTFKRKPGQNTKAFSNQGQLKKKPTALKKISFEDLMKQAESNNVPNSNGDQSLKNVNNKRPLLTKPGFKSRKVTKPNMKNVRRSEVSVTHRAENISKKDNGPVMVKLPTMGIAKPNAKLIQKMKHKNSKGKGFGDRYGKSSQDHYDSEEDSDLDDFIDDDEDNDGYGDLEAAGDPGYNRDDIWAIFNKGRPRPSHSYYEDDDGDMEANELEIMEEEEEARRMARLEDKREEAWLKKHEEAKRLQKLGR